MIEKKTLHLLVKTVEDRDNILKELEELHIKQDDDGGGDFYFKLQVGNTVYSCELNCEECMDKDEIETYYHIHSLNILIVKTFADIEAIIK